MYGYYNTKAKSNKDKILCKDKLYCIKTEYLRCNFSGIEQVGDSQVISGKDVTRTIKFKILGLVILSDAKISGDVTH